MQKFLNRQKFLNTVNQWVRDGSRIITFDTSPLGDFVMLKGRDGVGEVLAFFYEEDDYDQSELYSAEEDDAEAHLDPVAENPEDTRSPARKLVDETLEQVQETRVRLLEKLMSNPGVLATFGDDFVVQFEDIEIRTDDSRDFNVLREMRYEVNHRIRIREAIHFDSPTDVDKDLKEHSLRQNPEGNLESV